MALSDKKVPDNFHALYEPAVRAARGAPPTAAAAAGGPQRGMARLASDFFAGAGFGGFLAAGLVAVAVAGAESQPP